jgi:hypothetical protein
MKARFYKHINQYFIMTNFNSLIFIFLCLVGTSSCKLSEKEVLPANQIISENGIIINLEWYTGGSAIQAQNDVDLDLILQLGVEEVEVSATLFFEEVEIRNFYKDGTYLVRVEYFEGNTSLDYTLFLRGTSSSNNVTYQRSFRPADTGLNFDLLEVNKSGNTYTIIDL